MTLVVTGLLIAAFLLAWSNGANDNFKGVATLYGSGTTSFRGALAWATATTVAGSIVSVSAAGALLKAFTGAGILADDLVASSSLQLAVGAAAALTILLATRLGMPTSTTHALTGGLVGAGLAAHSDIAWAAMGQRFFAPLLLSPLMAIAIAAALYTAQRALSRGFGITRQTCLCIGDEAPEPVAMRPDGTAVMMRSGITVSKDTIANCVTRYEGSLIGVQAQSALDSLHFLSAGAVCFSRAVNDTPKIAALLMLAQPFGSTAASLSVVAAAMAAGGSFNARRVAETMSKRITSLTPGQGCSANLATSLLVLFASRWGLPVSTTHVSCGSLFGIGLVNRSGNGRTIAGILAAWLITLPLAGVLAAAMYVVRQGRLT